MPETGGRIDESPAPACPRCSSSNIAPVEVEHIDEGDALSVDVAPPVADPPNMRCTACGHTWWSPMGARG